MLNREEIGRSRRVVEFEVKNISIYLSQGKLPVDFVERLTALFPVLEEYSLTLPEFAQSHIYFLKLMLDVVHLDEDVFSTLSKKLASLTSYWMERGLFLDLSSSFLEIDTNCPKKLLEGDRSLFLSFLRSFHSQVELEIALYPSVKGKTKIIENLLRLKSIFTQSYMDLKDSSTSSLAEMDHIAFFHPSHLDLSCSTMDKAAIIHESKKVFDLFLSDVGLFDGRFLVGNFLSYLEHLCSVVFKFEFSLLFDEDLIQCYYTDAKRLPIIIASAVRGSSLLLMGAEHETVTQEVVKILGENQKALKQIQNLLNQTVSHLLLAKVLVSWNCHSSLIKVALDVENPLIKVLDKFYYGLFELEDGKELRFVIYLPVFLLRSNDKKIAPIILGASFNKKEVDQGKTLLKGLIHLEHLTDLIIQPQKPDEPDEVLNRDLEKIVMEQASPFIKESFLMVLRGLR